MNKCKFDGIFIVCLEYWAIEIKWNCELHGVVAYKSVANDVVLLYYNINVHPIECHSWTWHPSMLWDSNKVCVVFLQVSIACYFASKLSIFCELILSQGLSAQKSFFPTTKRISCQFVSIFCKQALELSWLLFLLFGGEIQSSFSLDISTKTRLYSGIMDLYTKKTGAVIIQVLFFRYFCC